jgi:murein DD-endopeptidase MepM/ murein hydrolase activator NlpD
VWVQYRPEPLRESDRYRGRRRAPSPPRSRYAAVITTAFIGAGVVAFGAGAGFKDAKVDALNSDAASVADAGMERDLAADRPSREKGLNSSINQAPKEAWILPFRHYRVTSLFGQRWGRLHAGVDLGGIPEGTPFGAVHDGVVVLARFNGGYGNCVIIDHGNGLQTVYGHASKLLVKEGQLVKAGDIIALIGNTGHSFGAHLHLEIHVDGQAVNPIPWFKEHGVDFFLETEAVFGGASD